MDESSLIASGLATVLLALVVLPYFFVIAPQFERGMALRSSLESQGYTFQIVSINSPVFTIMDKTLDEFLVHVSESPYPATIFIKYDPASVLYTFSADLKIGYSYVVN
jgi:hypothetical protein